MSTCTRSRALLNTVFLVAAAITFVAFVLAWFIPELPLRKTVAQGDMADTFAPPRDADSLVELVTKIGHLERREGAREIIRRIAARAGVELSPPACWLLARAREEDVADLEPLANRSRIACGVLVQARQELVQKGLLRSDAHGDGSYVLTDAGEQSLRALTHTGEQRLHDLLEGLAPTGKPRARAADRAPCAGLLDRRLDAPGSRPRRGDLERPASQHGRPGSPRRALNVSVFTPAYSPPAPRARMALWLQLE